MPEDTKAFALQPATEQFLSRAAHKLLLDGEWVPATSGRTFSTYNPSEGAALAELALAGIEDVDRAVVAARRALDGPWGKMLPAERERLLRRLGDLIGDHADELAELEAVDNGKPIKHVRRIDAPVAARRTWYAAGLPTKIAGYTPSVSIPNHFVYTRRESVGVVAIIIPWNYPLIHTMQKMSPALACGNTVVFKPAEEASLAVLRIGELAQEAGFPPGVINILTGLGHVTGASLAEHSGVDKIAFTGSVATGRKIVNASASNLKRVSLELGNKAANIIFADADIDAALPTAFRAAFGNSGQSCVAGTRLFVERPVYAEVVQALVTMARKVRVGHALVDETDLGPIVSKAQLETVLNYIEVGESEGAELQVGGERLHVDDYEDGYYLGPTIFTQATSEMRITREEIFGPVLTVFAFDTEAEAVARANETEYGLASGIWSRDVARAHRVAAALRSGVVYVNTYDLFDSAAPFGGMKGSGYGRDNGREAVEALTEVKAVWVATR